MLSKITHIYKTKRTKLVMLVCMLSFGVLAQQDPQYSQYMFNQLVINPAYAGSREALSSVVDLRQQWVSMPGAPKTGTIGVHSPLKIDYLGVGGHLIHENIGPTSWTAAYGDVSFRIKFTNSSLSFGLSPGIVNLNFKTAEMKFKNSGEVFESQYPGGKTVFDAGAGLYFKTKHFFLGASATHITNPVIYNKSISSNINTTTKMYFDLRPHFFLMSGFAFSVNENCVVSPTIMVKTIQSKQMSPVVDINCNVLLKKGIWLGASYKINYGYAALAQYYINENLKIGYCYEFGVTKIGTNGRSTHEVMIGYDLSLFKNKTLSPRQLFL